MSCVTGKEQLASREAIDLLGQVCCCVHNLPYINGFGCSLARLLLQCDYISTVCSTGMQYIEASKQETQQEHQPKASGTDISTLIADEVADIKSGRGQLLTWHKTNITGLLYLALDASAGESGVSVGHTIACDWHGVVCCAFAQQHHVEALAYNVDAGIGPVDLVQRMATDIQSTRQCKSRYVANTTAAHCSRCCRLDTCQTEALHAVQHVQCRLCLRFIPVEHVCYAKLEDMRKLAAKVLPEELPAREEAAELETV